MKYIWKNQIPDKHFWAFYYFCKRYGDDIKVINRKNGNKDLIIIKQKMIIAIDFDDTFTRDPRLWAQFIEIAQDRDHRVICVTARYDDGRHGDNMDIYSTIGKILPKDEIYFSGIEPKRQYMINQHEIEPDVWIDDIPLGIVE